MKILIVGSGGREHAIAWKLTQSRQVAQLFIAPGNAGTARLGENIAIAADDIEGLVQFAKKEALDLVVVGPEASLAAGLADALQKAGIRVFGPTRLAAEIETSKAFSKEFMVRHKIPTARYASFAHYEDACQYAEKLDYPFVLKTSGLAAGKGVILPDTIEEARAALHALMVERIFGSAGDEIIIEERLSGEEVSLLAFTDGVTVRAMLPAQDHKRLLDNDCGPNTGGMGAYAPAPVCSPELADQIIQTVLQPAVDGLRAEGRRFIGVLYAGIMLTEQGPKALEFNCRFGDPETQVLLPLLASDLLDIFSACIDGNLENTSIRWQSGAAATVVLASPGYPGSYQKGLEITGLDLVNTNVLAFHAGTHLDNGRTVTAGGRVLNITCCGSSLPDALTCAYTAIQKIEFEGMQYRRDIGQRAVRLTEKKKISSAYSAAGVNIDAGNQAVALMREAVRSTYSPAVLSGIGAFGGLYDARSLLAMRNPTLVASTDGVGTKVRLAAANNRYESIGVDIVNHCINDILVQGARPLFFLDYFATASLDPEIVARVVTGIAAACREAGCALLGGETAEMPGVYNTGEFDLAGTIVGVVDKDRVLPRPEIAAGDLLVGLASSGPHTNGYSLIRRIFANHSLSSIHPELGVSLADTLLAPHRSYLPVLEKALAQDPSPIKALAHLTGGGFIENIPRVLPSSLKVVIDTKSWEIPPLYKLIQSLGKINWEEMYRVFNMGIGMVAVVAPDHVSDFQILIDEPTFIIGKLVHGEKGVELQ